MASPLSEPRNRLVQVIKSKAFNGVDFIEIQAVDPASATLCVHFLNQVTLDNNPYTVSIAGGDRIQNIQVQPIDNTTAWSTDAEGRPILTLSVSPSGDFSNYTLSVASTLLDPMYLSATFSFKVFCPSDFDCSPQSECCAAAEPPLPAIDYSAKDFQSFKLALTDFSAQRYPSWQERSEADFGVMFLEALCAVADELSYLQDRVASEAALLTATQRRSLVSMARLVDYEPAPMLSATTTIQCNVTGTSVPTGALLSATTPDGVAVPFEIGAGLTDPIASYAVSPLWNALQPYWFDDSQQCLSCGATSMWIAGHGFNFKPQIALGNMPLLIQTDLPGESIREIVNLTAATEIFDPIFLDSTGAASQVTFIAWSASGALTRDHDLTQTQLFGNLLPATQGQRFSESFAIGTPPASATAIQLAVARYGPNGTASQPNWILRYPLSRSNAAQGRLTWLPNAASGDSALDPNALDPDALDPDADEPQPELLLSRQLPEPAPFSFATSLLDAAATEDAFTVDPAAWRVVATDGLGVTTQWEYDGDQGDTLRFGDGVFGAQPNDGDLFNVQYRIGLGASGNVAAEAIRNVDPGASGWLNAVRNPFSVTNGADQETAQHIQRMAPQAFRATQYRAVLATDYETAAESLPWVLKAGTAFRWTGSWLTVFTAADPKAGANATEADQTDLINLLNRRRLAGYESYAPPPVLVSIDLNITVCVATGWLASDVEACVLARLADAVQPDGSPGFFYADSFTFGTPLYRSALESAIQSVPGVAGVLDIRSRRRGASNSFQPLGDVLQLGSGELLRIENDPSYPERGVLRVIAEGGR